VDAGGRYQWRLEGLAGGGDMAAMLHAVGAAAFGLKPKKK
jgi:hypothetical protein